MKINEVLKKQIELIMPSREAIEEIEETAEKFCDELYDKIKKQKIKAEIFVGGSLVKGTLVKKKKYDVDVFVRFDEKYEDDKISEVLGRLLKDAKRIHGSRDYFQKNINGIFFEIIPVIKIKNTKQARNITDLSYFHVGYVKGKLKNKKLIDEIILTKTFMHAQNCYGAESYIHGFSGYAVELLIIHYGSLLNFAKAITKSNIEKEKIFIDDKKFYKNKNEILREMNEAKLQSPIILIDPTFKERNVCAGLNYETFDNFKGSCIKFLRNPSLDFFKDKDIKEDLEKKYGKKLNLVSVKTDKQTGDIAGTKSKKFFEFFISRLEKEFKVNLKEFSYDDKENNASFYFIVDKKNDEIVKGPETEDINNLKRFRQAHKNAFIKNGKVYAKIKHDLKFNEFVKKFKEKYKKIIKEMSVKNIELVR